MHPGIARTLAKNPVILSPPWRRRNPSDACGLHQSSTLYSHEIIEYVFGDFPSRTAISRELNLLCHAGRSLGQRMSALSIRPCVAALRFLYRRLPAGLRSCSFHLSTNHPLSFQTLTNSFPPHRKIAPLFSSTYELLVLSTLLQLPPFQVFARSFAKHPGGGGIVMTGNFVSLLAFHCRLRISVGLR